MTRRTCDVRRKENKHMDSTFQVLPLHAKMLRQMLLSLLKLCHL